MSARPLSTKKSRRLFDYKCLSDFNIKSVSVIIGRALALLVITLILSFSRDRLLILFYRRD